jgi:chemotaxis protein histidine kinase CheA
MKCPVCGKEIKDTETVCPECGARLTETAETTENTEETNTEQISETEEIPAEETEQPVTEEETPDQEQESPAVPDEQVQPEEEVKQETEEITETVSDEEKSSEEEATQPEEETAADTAAEAEESTQETAAKEKKPRGKKLGWIIILAALFIGITFGLFVMTKRGSGAEKTLNEYYQTLNQMYDVETVEDLTSVYRRIYTLTIPNEEYYESLKEWYGVSSKDELFSEMAEMNFSSLRDLDEELRNRSKFTWVINGTEVLEPAQAKDLLNASSEVYGLDKQAVSEVDRFDVALTDMDAEPFTTEQSVYVYQYNGRWYVMQ